jgi:hypothetical protein
MKNLSDLKKEENSIIEFLKRNPNIYFDVHINLNNYYAYINTTGNVCFTSYESDSKFVKYDELTHYFLDPFAINGNKQAILTNAIRYYVATRFAIKYNCNHKSALWALHNCEDQNWVCPVDDEYRQSFLNRIKFFKEEKELIRLSKSMIDELKTKYTFPNMVEIGSYKFDLLNLKYEEEDDYEDDYEEDDDDYYCEAGDFLFTIKYTNNIHPYHIALIENYLKEKEEEDKIPIFSEIKSILDKWSIDRWGELGEQRVRFTDSFKSEILAACPDDNCDGEVTVWQSLDNFGYKKEAKCLAVLCHPMYSTFILV